MMDLTTVTMKHLPASTSRLATSAYSRSFTHSCLRPTISLATTRAHDYSRQRSFHTTTRNHLKEFFPIKETPKTHQTRPAWPHPIYTEEEINSIVVAHRNAKTWSDKIAIAGVRTLRFGLDTATGYKHERAVAKGKLAVGAKASPPVMTERKYMIRNVFLESVAGVPGMVAGMLRHLHSMRRMKRDNGWIETLLEESFNERMHLLTFLKMAEPGRFMRMMVLAAQGVWFNFFFVAYLLSPATAHRFVGYLEEEAVLTYTRQIKDIEDGKLPLWEKMQAPDIAINYWKMPEGKQTIKDLLLYIRADEAKHREVNHTLANLDQKNDPNPFVSEYKDPSLPHPGKGIRHIKPTGWEREEVI